MAIGDYELRQVEWSPARLLAVVLVLVSAGINLAFATTTEQRLFALLGLGLLVGFITYFTDVWHPSMYLAGAFYVSVMVVVWVAVGMPMFLMGLLDAAVQVVLFALCLYLFALER